MRWIVLSYESRSLQLERLEQWCCKATRWQLFRVTLPLGLLLGIVAGLPAALGEGVVLGKKSIAGIDGIAFQRNRGLDQRAGVEIARFRRRRADADGAIGAPAVW